MKPPAELEKKIEQQTRRMQQAEQDRPNLIGQTIYVGTLGLMLVLPVIGGAYLGRWLDTLASGYSVRWTVSLILLGVFIGMFNVYYFIKE